MIASAYPTLVDFFQSVYSPRRLLGCSPATIKHYEVAIRHLDRHFRRKTTLQDIADEDRVAEFFVWFARGRKPATIATQRSQMQALLNFAHRRGMIATVPDIPRIRQLDAAPDSYSLQEVDRLVKAAWGAEGDVFGIPASFYWAANFATVYDTGVRSRALFLIELKHLRLDVPAIVFPPENMKNRKGQILRLDSSTAHIIRRTLNFDRKYLFPEPWCEATRYRHAKKFFRAAGLPCGRHDMYQKLRRSNATLMFAAGGDPVAQLGHSSDAVTRKSYLDQSNNIQAADLLDHPWKSMFYDDTDRQRRLF